MPFPSLSYKRLDRILHVLRRLGGCASMRDLQRSHGIWSWELEEAQDLGWLTIHRRKNRRGRISKLVEIISNSQSAICPPSRDALNRIIRHRHRSFAFYSVTPVTGVTLFSLRLHFGTEAYLLAYPSCKSRAAAAVGASRLMKRMDVQLMRRWLFCEADGRLSGSLPWRLSELIRDLQHIGVVTIRA